MTTFCYRQEQSYYRLFYNFKVSNQKLCQKTIIMQQPNKFDVLTFLRPSITKIIEQLF